MNKFKRFLFLVLSLVIALSVFTTSAFAESNDYVTKGTERISIPDSYTVEGIISVLHDKDGKIDSLSAAEDIYIDSKGIIYIADTGKNRIVRITKDGEILNIYTGSNLNGEPIPFKEPKGVFADKNGKVYIADTGNKRLVCMEAETGNTIKIFSDPSLTTDTLGENFIYNPSKIVVTETNIIYVVKDQTVMTLNMNNEFNGYFGQAPIGFDLLDTIIRLFAPANLKKVRTKRLAAYYINIALGDDGMVYSTTYDSVNGEVKRLNSIGKNTYKSSGSVSDGNLISGILGQFTSGADNPLAILLAKTSIAGESFWFGERFDDDGKYEMPVFADVCINNEGIVTVLNEKNGKLYQYDMNGNLLTVFGGKGDIKGKFSYPTSIETDNESNIYVLDKTLNNIQIFKPTKFITTVHTAVKLYDNGNYNEASKYWTEILEMSSTYELAQTGLAKTLNKDENYKEAMDMYYLSSDREGYSEAFNEFRRNIFRDYFFVVILGLVIAFIFLFLLFKRIKKTSDKALSFLSEEGKEKWSYKKHFELAVAILRYPVQTIDNIKGRNEKLRILPGIIIILLAIIVRTAYIFTVHFPLSDIDPKDANIWIEIFKMVVPIITWVVASYAITSIWDGESKIKEIFFASSLSLVPYILVTTLLIPLSQIMCANEIDIYGTIIQLTSYWTLFIIIAGLKSLNDYKIFRTIMATVIIGLTMLLIWAVCVLALTLVGQVISFVEDILFEIRMLLL